MLGSKTEERRIIFPERYKLLGFNTTFCLGCSNYNIGGNVEEAKKCLSCLAEQDEYYRARSTIKSIKVKKDENGRNVVEALIPI